MRFAYLKGHVAILSFPTPALSGSGTKGLISARYIKAPHFPIIQRYALLLVLSIFF
jgi:hypothetical protein